MRYRGSFFLCWVNSTGEKAGFEEVGPVDGSLIDGFTDEILVWKKPASGVSGSPLQGGGKPASGVKRSSGVKPASGGMEERLAPRGLSFCLKPQWKFIPLALSAGREYNSQELEPCDIFERKKSVGNECSDRLYHHRQRSRQWASSISNSVPACRLASHTRAIVRTLISRHRSAAFHMHE